MSQHGRTPLLFPALIMGVAVQSGLSIIRVNKHTWKIEVALRLQLHKMSEILRMKDSLPQNRCGIKGTFGSLGNFAIFIQSKGPMDAFLRLCMLFDGMWTVTLVLSKPTGWRMSSFWKQGYILNTLERSSYNPFKSCWVQRISSVLVSVESFISHYGLKNSITPNLTLCRGFLVKYLEPLLLCVSFALSVQCAALAGDKCVTLLQLVWIKRILQPISVVVVVTVLTELVTTAWIQSGL